MSLYMVIIIFFVKQKTAYEMRISDWSSDVCSSDLSISSAEATRSFSAVALVPSSENTAAASVEPTIAPIKKPSASDRSSSQVQNRAVMPAVISTPAADRSEERRVGKEWFPEE